MVNLLRFNFAFGVVTELPAFGGDIAGGEETDAIADTVDCGIVTAAVVGDGESICMVL